MIRYSKPAHRSLRVRAQVDIDAQVHSSINPEGQKERRRFLLKMSLSISARIKS